MTRPTDFDGSTGNSPPKPPNFRRWLTVQAADPTSPHRQAAHYAVWDRCPTNRPDRKPFVAHETIRRHARTAHHAPGVLLAALDRAYVDYIAQFPRGTAR
jgi:hypothetical protein